MIGAEYYLTTPEGAFILVTSEWDRAMPISGYASFRMFMGNRGEMHLSEILIDKDKDGYQQVWRARDGGTTDIYTDKGQLHVPSPFKQTRTATWKVAGQPDLALAIEERDRIEFNLETLTAWEK